MYFIKSRRSDLQLLQPLLADCSSSCQPFWGCWFHLIKSPGERKDCAHSSHSDVHKKQLLINHCLRSLTYWP